MDRNDAIKREQSQTSLISAEREQGRPVANCMNCAISTLVEDQKTKRMRRRCMPNDMWVNRHMCCEEWSGSAKALSDRFVGAVSVRGIMTEKKR